MNPVFRIFYPGQARKRLPARRDDTAKPGDDTTKPGSSQPGDTESSSGNGEETRPDTGIPFIKDEDGKIGWDVIHAEEEKAVPLTWI